MSFLHLLQPEFAVIDMESMSSDQVLTKIAETAVKSPLLSHIPAKELCKSLKSREKLGSTGLGNGIAIPHCTVEGLSDFVVGIVKAQNPISFKSLDKKPARLFFFIIGPPEMRNKHIQILSSISQLVKTPEAVEKLVSASDSKELMEKLRSLAPLNTRFEEKRDRSLIQVYIQEEGIFEDILEILSGIAGSSISVVEGANAGRYLNNTPLFSSWWGDDPDRYLRIVSAVIPKTSCNNAVRMINMVRNTLSDEPGLMLTITDLLYSSGSLNF